MKKLSFQNFNERKTTIFSLVLIVQQLVVLSALAFLFFMQSPENRSAIRLFVPALLLPCLLSAYLIIHIFLRMRGDSAALIQTIGQVEQLNRTLRGQRHDFLNHLQVVHGLIELNEFDEARNYIDHVYGDIQRVSRVMRTAHPALNALLQAKSAACLDRGIGIEINITTQLNLLPLEAWEMCRLLGNLIDNAIDAVEGREQPVIRIGAVEGMTHYQLTVENNGPAIPPHIGGSMFLPGVSTKGEGRGMGLSIVRRLLEDCGGDVRVSNGAGWTNFLVTLPKEAAVIRAAGAL